MSRAEGRKKLRPEDLTVEHVPIDELKQHPRNPRAGDPETIRNSIRAHGQFRAIIISEDDFILAGNHTYQAALGERLKTLAVHRLPIKHDSQQAIEIMLADNRTSDFSRYDDGTLATLLSELKDPLAAAWEPGDVTRLFERMEASGFLNDLAGDGEINKLMHGARIGQDARKFELPVTATEREEIMDLLNTLKERYKVGTLTVALITALRYAIAGRSNGAKATPSR